MARAEASKDIGSSTPEDATSSLTRLPSPPPSEGPSLPDHDDGKATATATATATAKAKAKVTGKASEGGDPDESPSRPHADGPYVLWGLSVVEPDEFGPGEGSAPRSFYQDQPWKGINNGLPGSDRDHHDRDGEGGESKAVLLYSVKADIRDKTHKPGNTPATWKEEPVDFQFGKDAQLLHRHFPVIELLSPRLIRVMTLLMAYNPVHPGEFVRYEGDKDTFEEFMLYYAELKAYFHTYLRSRPHDQPRDPGLDIGDCGDAEIADAMPAILQFGALKADTEPCDEATAYDLAVLLRLLAPMYRIQVVPTMTSRLRSPEPLVKFDWLWLLMKPGTLVYFQPAALDEIHRQAFIVESWSYHEAAIGHFRDEMENMERFEMELWGIQHDKTFQQVIRRPVIPIFEGARPVRTLQVIPADIQDRWDGGDFRRKLEKRGRNYLSILRESGAHREYKNPRSGYGGQVVIDPKAYREYANDYRRSDRDELADGPGNKRFRELTDFALSNSETFPRIDEVYRLLPPTIDGLSLKSKKWTEFEVGNISEGAPARSPNQLENELVLVSDVDKESLRTVLAKGEKFVGDSSDFVHGKGEGKIFLLYGPPGTGKTLTVECVANDTGRPLLTLTAQDVGLANGTDAEESFQQWFSLAAKWEAILLIDEADLFLEQRREGSLDRNSLSTIFLRTMEYYEGVLFLTTNRAGHIDDSFISRITCPIAYHPLSQDTKTKIVKKFVRRYEESGTIEFQPRAENYVIEHCAELNGRELRNVLQNAVAMAEVQQRSERKLAHPGRPSPEGHQVVSVKWHHVKAAVERQINFILYLNKLKGKDEFARARSKQDYLLAPPT